VVDSRASLLYKIRFSMIVLTSVCSDDLSFVMYDCYFLFCRTNFIKTNFFKIDLDYLEIKKVTPK